jgi:hypothetical protein
MLKKHFLQYLHQDWTLIAQQLRSELIEGGDDESARMERLRKADQWIAHYAGQLKELYGIDT